MQSKADLDRQLIQLCDRGELGKAQRLASQHGKSVAYITRIVNQQTKDLDRLNRAVNDPTHKGMGLVRATNPSGFS